MKMKGKRIKLIYIAGLGRSGSTLLDRILGQSHRIINVGELENILHFGFHENEICTCGEHFQSCLFWKEVINRIEQKQVLQNLKTLAELKKLLRMRHIPFFLTTKVMGSQRHHALTEFLDTWLFLLRTIADVSGKEVIVDSSKTPTLIFLLRRCIDIDLRVIHLVRDSRAVAYSYSRKKNTPTGAGALREIKRKSVIDSSLGWVSWNLAVEMCRLIGENIIRIRYEDLISSTKQVLEDISSFIEEPVPVIEGAAASVFFGETHSIAGNPIRFLSGDVQLKMDTEWENKMNLYKRALVTTITWPLLMKYGY